MDRLRMGGEQKKKKEKEGAHFFSSSRLLLSHHHLHPIITTLPSSPLLSASTRILFFLFSFFLPIISFFPSVVGMSRLREVPVVYGPTRATSEALRARCETLGVTFNPEANATTKGREVMNVLGEDPREGIAPLSLPAQVYNTRAHQELLNALFAKTKSLNNDDFAFKNGVAAFAIAGAMGKFFLFLFRPMVPFSISLFCCCCGRHRQDHHLPGIHRYLQRCLSPGCANLHHLPGAHPGSSSGQVRLVPHHPHRPSQQGLHRLPRRRDGRESQRSPLQQA